MFRGSDRSCVVDHERWVLPEEEQKLSHVPSAHVPYVPAPVAATDPNRQSQDNVFQFDEVLPTLCFANQERMAIGAR